MKTKCYLITLNWLADLIKELQELNNLSDKLEKIKRDQKKIVDNFKRLNNE